LKSDTFGEIRLGPGPGGLVVTRDAGRARPWSRWFARRLLAREARALAALAGVPGVPALIEVGPERLVRSYIDGRPLQEAQVRDPAYFAAAAKLLFRLHVHGVAHNDLAKEPNWLVDADGRPAIIDFQLAWHVNRRGRLFRLLAREDLRHLLKHKRSYCSEHLTRRERHLLDNPSLPSRIWMRIGKPVYLLVTRRLLGWSDREGAADRGAPDA